MLLKYSYNYVIEQLSLHKILTVNLNGMFDAMAKALSFFGTCRRYDTRMKQMFVVLALGVCAWDINVCKLQDILVSNLFFLSRHVVQ